MVRFVTNAQLEWFDQKGHGVVRADSVIGADKSGRTQEINPGTVKSFRPRSVWGTVKTDIPHKYPHMDVSQRIASQWGSQWVRLQTDYLVEDWLVRQGHRVTTGSVRIITRIRICSDSAHKVTVEVQ
jgi:hypothetical protein